MLKYKHHTNSILYAHTGKTTLVKGVFLYFRVGIWVRVVTTRGLTLFRHILRGVLFYLVVAMRYFLPYLIFDALEWLFADKEKRARMLLPYNCQCCELLGMCRDKENDWKCRHGCMILNYERREKGILPPRCKTCEYLHTCRDESNKWKCRNGCIIINQQKNTYD